MFTGPPPMTDDQINILMDKVDALPEKLMPDNILDYLVQKKIVTVEEQGQLHNFYEAKPFRAISLVRLLTTKQDEAFYVLIQACKECSMPHLAKLLEDAGTC